MQGLRPPPHATQTHAQRSLKCAYESKCSMRLKARKHPDDLWSCKHLGTTCLPSNLSICCAVNTYRISRLLTVRHIVCLQFTCMHLFVFVSQSGFISFTAHPPIHPACKAACREPRGNPTRALGREPPARPSVL